MVDARSDGQGSNGQGSEAGARSDVKPRHVLCFLGEENALSPLCDAASAAISDFATGFSVDRTYSQDQPDARMSRSFSICGDRVVPGAWTSADEAAVASHGSVLYVLGPPMTAETAVIVSAAALLLVDTLISAGAVAVKGESAGVAHSLSRWRQFAADGAQALRSHDDFLLRRAARLSFAKRPLLGESFVESVGFHLVGLPEIYVARDLVSDREAVALIDAVADDIALLGLDAVLRDRKARLSFASSYAEDDFKFNPYGSVQLEQR
ncbi:MAG TPA: hypothetical protein VMM15_35230 [Bradyrhizobium sp.]|nr:hypothetical protein [Bradyrhizobium sp.]